MKNRSCNGQPNISRLRATDSSHKFLNDECFGRIVYTGYFVYITNSGEIRRPPGPRGGGGGDSLEF